MSNYLTIWVSEYSSIRASHNPSIRASHNLSIRASERTGSDWRVILNTEHRVPTHRSLCANQTILTESEYFHHNNNANINSNILTKQTNNNNVNNIKRTNPPRRIWIPPTGRDTGFKHWETPQQWFSYLDNALLSHTVQTDNWRNIVFLLLIHFHTDNCIMKKVNIQFFTHDKQVNSWVYRNLISINAETPLYQKPRFTLLKPKGHFSQKMWLDLFFKNTVLQ